ncbi:MAG: hypothetical protein GWP91_03760 [Rhodobacterales bacterium]|nr:hypothetical protein [Rhodobacterales bacterium]
MSTFFFHLDVLMDALEPIKHHAERAALRRCRSVNDLSNLATTGGGWLTPGTLDPRLKLVKHGSGTYLIVSYQDGWTTRVAMEPFPK